MQGSCTTSIRGVTIRACDRRNRPIRAWVKNVRLHHSTPDWSYQQSYDTSPIFKEHPNTSYCEKIRCTFNKIGVNRYFDSILVY
jgi:hypothetical protein